MKLIKAICIICSMLLWCGCGTQKHDFKAVGEVLNVSDDSLCLVLKECSYEVLDGVYMVNVLCDGEYSDIGIGDIVEITFGDLIETEPITLTKVESIQVMQKSVIESITDNSLKPDFACATELELIYEDELYSYYFSCIKSDYIIVCFKDGTSMNIKEALGKEKISMHDLDIYGVEYIVEEKS